MISRPTVGTSVAVLLFGILVAYLALTTYQRGGPAGEAIAITNVTVIDADGTPPQRQTVIIRNGRIVTLAAPDSQPPAASTVVDGTGKFLIPGLWDMHVHLATRPEPRLAE